MVKGTVKNTKPIEIPPLQTVHVQRLSRVNGHDKRVNVVTDTSHKVYSKAVVTIPGYSYLPLNLKLLLLPSLQLMWYPLPRLLLKQPLWAVPILHMLKVNLSLKVLKDPKIDPSLPLRNLKTIQWDCQLVRARTKGSEGFN